MEPDYSVPGYIADRRSRLKDALRSRSRIEHYGQRGADHPILCHACGFQERMAWSRGQRCPKCESGQFFPKVRKHIGIKNWKHIGICCGLIILVVSGIIRTANKISPPAAAQVTRVLICLRGEHVFEKKIDDKALFPVACDHRWHFGKTAVPALSCEKGHVFGMDMKKVIQDNAAIVCPQCESTHIKTLIAKDNISQP